MPLILGRSCDLVNARHQKRETPKDRIGGTWKADFLGDAGSRQLGRPFKAPQPVTLGLSGFGVELVCLQPIVGWKKTLTPGDEEACIAVYRGLGDFSEAIKNHSVARSISSSSPLFSALRSALD